MNCSSPKSKSNLDENYLSTIDTTSPNSLEDKKVIELGNVPKKLRKCLTKREIFNVIELVMPDTFTLMSNEMIAIKYPLKRSSDFVVYTDRDAAVNIAFEYFSKPILKEELPTLKGMLEGQFSKPEIEFRNSEIKEINGSNFVMLEMVTPGIDTKIYNLMFTTSARGRLLMGSFNCPVDVMEQWRPIR